MVIVVEWGLIHVLVLERVNSIRPAEEVSTNEPVSGQMKTPNTRIIT